MKTKIELKSVKKSFGEHTVFQNINMSINEFEKVCIVGPSGAGKSTLLRCINCLENVDEGQIFIDGKEITSAGKKEKREYVKKNGMVFQRFNLFSNMTVLDNITFAPVVNKLMTKKEAQEFAVELLKTVGLEEKIKAYPHQLSGGQSQRIAIVRALANKPEILLFDEPTSALDPEMVAEVREMINNLAKTNITIAIVTHEMNFVKQIADRVAFLDGGKLYAYCSVDDFFAHENERIKAFLQYNNEL